MKIYRNFFIRDVDVSYYRGDLSFERWYENVVDSDDEITTSKPEDADLILTSDEVYKDTENAKEILVIIKDRPDTKLCVLCGTRYPSFDFAKRNCLKVLNRTDAILHNSVFREEDLKKINLEGVHALKRLGFEAAVQQAVRAVIEKDKQLGK